MDKPKANTKARFQADEYLDFFTSKVNQIREDTQNAPPPTAQPLNPDVSLAEFVPVTPEDICKLLTTTPTKNCQLDPVPTSILKQLPGTFSVILCHLINASLMAGIVPVSQKHALVLPRLKKPSLDPLNLASYRSISNLSFASKQIGRAHV